MLATSYSAVTANYGLEFSWFVRQGQLQVGAESIHPRTRQSEDQLPDVQIGGSQKEEDGDGV